MVWVAHMKTTIDLADGLHRQAKALAKKRGVTFREVVEDALREAMIKAADEVSAVPAEEFTWPTVAGGLQPGLSWDDMNDLIRESNEYRMNKIIKQLK